MRDIARIHAGMSNHPDLLPQVVPLVERLKRVATLWAESTGRTLGALASTVANHGSFFERLETPGAGTTTATLEKFAQFLVEPDNWPEGKVPDEVCRFAHAVGISGGACALSPDIQTENIALPDAAVAQTGSASGRTPGHEPGAPAAPDALMACPPSGADGAAGDDLTGVAA
jgi:hypothetical protein